MSKSGVKLNLGCGTDKKSGWVNIDALPELKPDIVHDLHDPLPFDDNSVAEVLAQDILEHFTKEDVAFVISEIARVLKQDGKLTVRIPNIDDIITRFRHQPETRNQFLYGTTAETGIFGAHKVGFTPKLLVALMLQHGLEFSSLRGEQTNYVAAFKKNFDAIPQVKKVTFINQSLGMGGAEVFAADLLTALANRGITVTTYAAHQPFVELLKEKNLVAHHIPVVVDVVGDWKGLVKAPLQLPKAVWQYYQIFRREADADVVLFSSFFEKIIGSWLAQLFNLPVVWLEFGPIHPLLNKFFKLPKLLYYSVKQIPEKVIVPTEHTKQALITGASIALSKLAIIPCGRNITPPKDIKEKANHLVCVSRLEKGKGQDLLLWAFAQVQNKIPEAHLSIVGEGDFLTELQKLTAELNLSEALTFTGRVENSLETMQSATVCVFPSMWELEGFGLVAVEAMALGKPVVAFDRPPINEVVTDKKEGLLAKAGDHQDLADKIIMLLQDVEMRNQLGEQGRQAYKNKFEIEYIAKKYLAVLAKTLARHRAQYYLSKS